MVDNNQVCCVFVYNHKHDNIDKLHKLYASRFSSIYHLIPFYQGDNPQVIPVYENSYTFQGYFAQAYKSIYHEKFSHYIFIADDLILHPDINESNILQELRLDNNSAYIKELISLSDVNFKNWTHSLSAIQTFSRVCHKDTFVKVNELLPSYEQAMKKFHKHNIYCQDITAQNIENCNGNYLLCSKSFIAMVAEKIAANGSYPMPYPLAMGYSDFIIIPSKSMQPFCHYSGIFAAIGLFVESAIPTAMLLACKHIVTEKETLWHGTEFWDFNTIFYAQQKNYDLQCLLQAFDIRQLYIHPIKLSTWSDKNL